MTKMMGLGIVIGEVTKFFVEAIKYWPHCGNNNFKFMDNLLYFKECLYILEGPLHLQFFQVQNDFLAIGRFVFNKTLELVSQDFWWPQM